MKAMREKRKWLSRAAVRLAAMLCAAFCAACGPGDADPTGEASRGRPMRMAKLAEEAGNREEAIRWYETALRRRPQMALAHRQLAELFKTGQPPDIPAALYHYRKFLALAPESPDREFIEEQVDYCRQYIAESAEGDTHGLTWELDSLREKITAADRDRVAARAEADELRRQLAALQTAAARQVPPAPSAPGTLRTPATPQTPSRSADAARGPRTYTVQSGDTLTKIAKKHNTTIRAIVQANPNVDPNRLKIGTVLVIPSTP